MHCFHSLIKVKDAYTISFFEFFSGIFSNSNDLTPKNIDFLSDGWVGRCLLMANFGWNDESTFLNLILFIFHDIHKYQRHMPILFM